MQSNPCAAKVLAAFNQVFRCDLNEDAVVWGESGIHGGAWNNVLYLPFASEDSASVRIFNAVMPGRYALDGWKNYLLGIGRHLHIPSGGESVPCSPAIPFEKENLGGKLSLRFTVHVDNGYPYNPAGFVYHMIRNVAMSGSRNPCP